jgi:galactose-3-O-sulfotransferase 2
LRIGLPRNEGNYICKHQPFKKDCTNDTNFDIIANHHVWSPVIEQVLPRATKITILREPLSQLVSAFQYFPANIFQTNGHRNDKNLESFENFIENSIPSGEKVVIRENTHNPMAFDLGLSGLYRDKSEKELADWLVDYYDLVMITEHFDESLILLKELLSLEFSDIAYLKSNENGKKTFQSSDISEKTKKQAYAMDKVDNALFKKANETLWQKIESYGFENMKQEKQAFRVFCEQIDQTNRFFHLSEMEFIHFMRQKQHENQ